MVSHSNNEPEPYAKYKIKQSDQHNFSHYKLYIPPPSEYEDVRTSQVSQPSMQTSVTFGDGLRRPAELFGSLKKAGQRFVGADQILGSINGIKKLTGRKSKCQCRHHQQKLIQKGIDIPQNNAFTEAKRIFRGEGIIASPRYGKCTQ
jgi:hypothetical protein